jgi:hypothetical protein
VHVRSTGGGQTDCAFSQETHSVVKARRIPRLRPSKSWYTSSGVLILAIFVCCNFGGELGFPRRLGRDLKEYRPPWAKHHLFCQVLQADSWNPTFSCVYVRVPPFFPGTRGISGGIAWWWQLERHRQNHSEDEHLLPCSHSCRMSCKSRRTSSSTLFHNLQDQ